nr:tetratricopeptide repeat protein [uncultured Holophaga sp.]
MIRSRHARHCLALPFLATAGLLAAPQGQNLLDQAQRLYHGGHFAQAIAVYRTFLMENPAHVGAWRDLGYCQQRTGNLEEAFRVWGNLLALDPHDSLTLNALGEAHLARGDYRRALDFLERSLKVKGDQPRIRIRIGEAYQGLASWEKAARTYDSLLRKEPDRTDLLLRRAGLEEEQGHLEAAIRRLEEAAHRLPGSRAALSPTLTRLYATLGDQACQAQDYAKAQKALESGLTWAPENLHLQSSLGWTLRGKGELRGAIVAWKRALAASGRPSTSLLRAIGEAQLELNELAEAHETLLEAHRLLPDEPSPCLLLLELGLRQDDQAQQNGALKALMGIPQLPGEWADRAAQRFVDKGLARRGLEAFSALPLSTPHRARGMARLHAALSSTASRDGHLDEAVRLGRLALEEDPGNRQALRDLGWALARKGDWKACTEIWSAYASIHPNDALAFDLLSQAHLFRQDYVAAIAAARQALVISPGLKSARLRLLSAYARDNQVDKASRLGRELAAEFPEDLQVRYRLAETLTRIRDHAEAREQWAKARALDPSNLRPVMQWIHESYALEDYGAALEEAHRLAGTQASPEPALLFLAQDAELTGHYQKAAAWYQRLAERTPTQDRYWLQQIRMLRLSNSPQAALDTVQKGLSFQPKSAALRMAQAEGLLAMGHAEAALPRFQELARENPGNASAFHGLINSLLGTHSYASALEQLDQPGYRKSFFSEFDRDLLRAEACSGMGRTEEARGLLARVAEPGDGRVYLPIILYHGIEEQERSASISTGRFESQMAALAQGGYTAISLEEMTEMTAGRKPWPKRPIIITFDDARSDSFLKADPILAKYGLKASMFVPTADSAATQDLFHASWQTLRRMQGSGRWELEGHGHEAHDPIPVDAEGHTGKFLVDRAWIQDLERPETPQEFMARLEEDYARCQNTLIRLVPGSHPVAYAFPYSEAGQISVADNHQATATNEQVWPRHFRFGMLQNSNGYNAILPGEGEPRILWRYEPARTWDGQELLSQLSREHPSNQARLQMSSLSLWQGRLENSRRELLVLGEEIPALRPDIERRLAEVSWVEDRPREAAMHLAACHDLLPAQPPAQDAALRHRLAWENQPRIQVGGEHLETSEHRLHDRTFLRGTLPLAAPVDLEIQTGTFRFEERGLGTLRGRELEGRASWAPTRHFSTTVWGGLRDFDSIANRRRAGVDLRYSRDAHDLHLGASRDDLDSVAALLAWNRAWNKEARYTLKVARWTFQSSATLASISDGNRMDRERLAALYTPRATPSWQIGFEGQRADSRFHTSRYYTPMAYSAVRLLTAYQQTRQDGSAFRLQLAGGRSDDAINGGRWSGNINLEWVNEWTPRLRSILSASGGSSTGFSYTQVGASAVYRF